MTLCEGRCFALCRVVRQHIRLAGLVSAGSAGERGADSQWPAVNYAPAEPRPNTAASSRAYLITRRCQATGKATMAGRSGAVREAMGPATRTAWTGRQAPCAAHPRSLRPRYG